MKYKQPRIARIRFVGLVVLGLSFATLVGCGGGGGRVSGKVTVQGKEVQGGSVTFTPVTAGERNPGKPASAAVGKDGTYVVAEPVMTGKNKVTYLPPTVEWDATKAKPGDQAPRSPYDGFAPKTEEIEVKSGASTIDIELIPTGKR